MTDKPLTANQKIFVSEYIIDRNATRAYLKAYPNVKKKETAGAAAPRLLENARVATAIADALDAQQKRTEITADKTIRECGRIAFSDLRKLFDEDGRLKPIHELDDEIAPAISSIEVVTKPGLDGEVIYIHKVKTWDKNAAINNLGKHFKLFIERQEHTGKDGGPIETNDQAASALMEKIFDATQSQRAMPADGEDDGAAGNSE